MYKVAGLFSYQEGAIRTINIRGIAEVVERPSYTEKEIENAKRCRCYYMYLWRNQ